MTYLENHDQVANSAYGKRLHQLRVAGPSIARMTAWLLLGPATPMLFQGQEFSILGAVPLSSPITSRSWPRRSAAGGSSSSRSSRVSPTTASSRVLAPPDANATFTRCKLDLSRARAACREAYALHSDLLALRRDDPVLARAGTYRPEGAVLGSGRVPAALLDAAHGDRLLIVNLDCDLDFTPAREPLLAPPFGARWRLVVEQRSAAPTAAQGVAPLDPDGPWLMPGGSAMFFVPEQR